jgi:hypothetical protein
MIQFVAVTAQHPRRPSLVSQACPPSYVRRVLMVLLPEPTRPEYKAEHLPASSTEVRNAWGSTSAPSYALIASGLFK